MQLLLEIRMGDAIQGRTEALKKELRPFSVASLRSSGRRDDEERRI